VLRVVSSSFDTPVGSRAALATGVVLPRTSKKRCGPAHDDRRPADAGAFAPNAWGLHDMEGCSMRLLWCCGRADARSVNIA